jgi:outer membrane receptor protein involved in Fe transport
VPGTGLSVTGQRQINNTFLVDGASANDDAADLPGTFYSQEVIREFQVVTAGGIAEFGRASAGIVNIITRSGSNRWAGRGYVFFRDDAFDAKNPLAPAKDPLRQWQYGASLGGPIERDRTFLFANVEQTRLDSSSVITIQPANVGAVNAGLDAIGYRGPRIETGLFATGYDTTNVFLKLDHRLSEKALLTARYSYYGIASENARNVGGLNAVSRGTALENTDHTLAVNAVVTPSSRLVNETRLLYTRSRLGAPPNDLTGPAVNIAGVASFGTATFSPTVRDIDLYQLSNVTTLARGAHSLKGGAELLWNRLRIEFPGALQGVYTFSSLPSFLAARYVTYQQAFGEAEQLQSNPNLGFFVQDEWRLRRDLTVNAGLRYDLQFLPDPIETDQDNLSPRLGVAWSPGGGRTVVRASVGLFYDRIPLRATSNALQRDGTKYRVAVLPFGQAGAPVFPDVLPAFPEGLLASITTIDPGIENASAWRTGVQVDRELGANTALSVGYVGVRTSGLILSRNVNVPTLSAAEAAARGIPNLGRPDPRWANISRFGSLGEARYDGMVVSFRRRFTRSVSGRVSYTLSKAEDDAGNAFFFTPQDSNDIAGEWGPSDNDQRHRLVVSGSVEGPADLTGFWRVLRGFTLSGVFSYGSALPFNVLTGTDRNNDTSVNDRPAGVGRNSERGFDFASLDLRLAKRFALGRRGGIEALVEGFNVLNRANYQLPNGTFGPGPTPRAGFGQPTQAADPRQIQFGLRVDF